MQSLKNDKIEKEIVTCPLCQHEFDSSGDNCHSGCPISAGCNSIKCPNCQYEFVAHSSIVSFVQKFLKRKK